MSDIMTPIPFGNLMTWIVEEHKKEPSSGSGVLLLQIRQRPMRSSDASWRLPSDRQQAPTHSWLRIS